MLNVRSEPERTAVRCLSSFFEAFPIFSLSLASSSRHGSKQNQSDKAKLSATSPRRAPGQDQWIYPAVHVWKASVFLRSILHVFGSGAAVRTRAQELKQRRKKADFLNIPTKIRRCFLLFVAWRLRTGSSGEQLHLGVCLGVPELVPPTCVWHQVRARR